MMRKINTVLNHTAYAFFLLGVMSGIAMVILCVFPMSWRGCCS